MITELEGYYRCPTEEEQILIRSRKFPKQWDFFKLVSVLCLLGGVAIAIADPIVSYMITILFLSALFFCLSLVVNKRNRLCRNIKHGKYKVLPCKVYDMKRLDFYNGSFTSNSPHVKVVTDDGVRSDRWFEIDGKLEAYIIANKTLPLLLISDGKSEVVINYTD